MFKVILIGSVCLYLLLYHFCTVALAGVICGGIYLLCHYKLVAVDSKDRKDDLMEEELYVTGEEKEKEADKAAEKRMKPGYNRDPEWERVSRQLQKQVDEAEKKEEQEMRLEDLTNEVA
jgi:hypothetical protein